MDSVDSARFIKTLSVSSTSSDVVDGDLGALLFREQRLFRDLALDRRA
jgi:hypothetical protein